MPTGVLTVTLAEGSNLRDMDVFTKMDPYCFVSLGSNKQRSRTHHFGGKNPSWHQTFTFNVSEGMDKLHLEAWDEDTVRDDFIGWAEIPLYPAFQSYTNDGWHNIVTQTNRGAGKIHLVLNFRPGAVPGYGAPQPMGYPQQQPYYPPQQQYPPPQQYPPQQAYPPQQQMYPPQQQMYPPQQQFYQPPPPPVYMAPQVVVAPPVFIPPPAPGIVFVEPAGIFNPHIDIHLGGRRHHHHHHHGGFFF
eukprot:Opistho-2@11989